MPYHFQFLINPYDLENGVFMTTMYKRAYAEPYEKPRSNGAGVGPGDDAPCFVAALAGAVPKLVPALVTRVLGSSLKPYENVKGTLGEIFCNTTLRGNVASAAVGFAAADVSNVIGILMQVKEAHGPFAGLFAFRFVKKSRALMAFTRFDPTCVLELDGVQSESTDRFYESMWAALDRHGIIYTFHWGKMHSMTPQRLARAYGDAPLRFEQVRRRLLEPAALLAFRNEAQHGWLVSETPDSGDARV
jgi:hypothetical protein